MKPDVVSFDSVASTTYGPHSGCGTSGFSGTSAAAPHVAGAAALVQDRFAGAIPGEVRARLERGALGIPSDPMLLAPVLKDSTWGAGLLRLDPLVARGPLAFVRSSWLPDSGGFLCCNDELYLVNADGTGLHRLT